MKYESIKYCIKFAKSFFVADVPEAEEELTAIQARIEKLTEYPERLQKAIIELEALNHRAFTEGSRIAGKIEGVKLALSYFEEMTK